MGKQPLYCWQIYWKLEDPDTQVSHILCPIDYRHPYESDTDIDDSDTDSESNLELHRVYLRKQRHNELLEMDTQFEVSKQLLSEQLQATMRSEYPELLDKSEV